MKKFLAVAFGSILVNRGIDSSVLWEYPMQTCAVVGIGLGVAWLARKAFIHVADRAATARWQQHFPKKS